MPPALVSLRELLQARTLPTDARTQIANRLLQLETFPESGSRITEDGNWEGSRVLFGPWWFMFIYVYDRENDEVRVTAIEDKRTANGAQSAG